MAGIVASYNQVPRIRQINANKLIVPVGGSNPIDLSNVELPNVRGQVRIIITSNDNGFMSAFSVIGGFGEFPGDQTQNWYSQLNTNVNCDIFQTTENIIEIITPPADAGGRVYRFVFFPIQSKAPEVMQTSVNILGNNSINILLIKQLNVEGW